VAGGGPIQWVAIATTAACEKNSEGITRSKGTQLGPQTTKTDCQRLCDRAGPTCLAVDWYTESLWCNTYHTQPCTHPQKTADGGSSYRKVTAPVDPAVAARLASKLAALEAMIVGDPVPPLEEWWAAADGTPSCVRSGRTIQVSWLVGWLVGWSLRCRVGWLHRETFKNFISRAVAMFASSSAWVEAAFRQWSLSASCLLRGMAVEQLLLAVRERR
jgi:hypothetical protein